MIKKALVSVWISVLAGMALFAVSAAFGAELPSDVPPAGLVSPTFSGVTIDPTGSISAGMIVPGEIIDKNGVSVDTGDLHIDGGMEVYKELKVKGALKAEGGISSSSSDPVAVNDGLYVSGYVSIDGEISSGSSAALEVGEDLTVYGHVTADRFGTYTSADSSMISIPKNSTAQAIATCPTGTYIVSCQSRSSYASDAVIAGSGDFSNFFTDEVYINYAYADLDTADNFCKVRGKNRNITYERYVGATAICLNPGI